MKYPIWYFCPPLSTPTEVLWSLISSHLEKCFQVLSGCKKCKCVFISMPFEVAFSLPLTFGGVNEVEPECKLLTLDSGLVWIASQAVVHALMGWSSPLFCRPESGAHSQSNKWIWEYFVLYGGLESSGCNGGHLVLAGAAYVLLANLVKWLEKVRNNCCAVYFLCLSTTLWLHTHARTNGTHMPSPWSHTLFPVWAPNVSLTEGLAPEPLEMEAVFHLAGLLQPEANRKCPTAGTWFEVMVLIWLIRIPG